MHTPYRKIQIIALLAFALGYTPFLFAQERFKESALSFDPIVNPPQQARDYRSQGYTMQRAGNLDGAMQMYRKAIEIDPSYVVCYNDLGIIYEEKGLLDQAEDCYLKATKVDPAYPSSYSNLALFYENKRDLTKASYYWQKRLEVGSADDPWTEKAKQHLQDMAALTDVNSQASREQEVLSLAREVQSERLRTQKDNKELAKVYFNKARLHYRQGNELAAYQEASNAYQLDPDNAQIQEFVDKIKIRQLSH